VGFPPVGERWKDTVIAWPDTFRGEGAKEMFTGRDLRVNGEGMPASEAMASLPFAIYSNAPVAALLYLQGAAASRPPS
jgi:hypothetical protein